MYILHSIRVYLIVMIALVFKDTTLEKNMIWLTAYDESRAIRDVKRGKVSPSKILVLSKPFLILISSF